MEINKIDKQWIDEARVWLAEYELYDKSAPAIPDVGFESWYQALLWYKTPEPTMRAFQIQALLNTVDVQTAHIKEIEEALRWLLHLCNDVSKSGGKPTSDEWDEAWRNAMFVLEDKKNERQP